MPDAGRLDTVLGQTRPMRVMHEGQWNISAPTVRRMVGQQFPAWSELAVTRVPSDGTVNTLFRLGEDLVLRFPLLPHAEPSRRGELVEAHRLVAALAARVAVTVPVPLEIGEPADGYPGFWGVSRWIPGHAADRGRIRDLDAFARDLASFVSALHSVPTEEIRWDKVSRGGPLRECDQKVRWCIEQSAGLVDSTRIGAAWDECLAATGDAIDDVWLHADLMPGNLLVRDGRLAGVIDWEMMGVGDGAVDLMPAWNLLPAGPRETFREVLAVDDRTWARGRGWSLCQAIVALPYYARTNKVMADLAVRTLAAVSG